MSWVYAAQVRYPERITLIRGNHESRQITQVRPGTTACVCASTHWCSRSLGAASYAGHLLFLLLLPLCLCCTCCRRRCHRCHAAAAPAAVAPVLLSLLPALLPSLLPSPLSTPTTLVARRT